jgi:hypothetical protein
MSKLLETDGHFGLNPELKAVRLKGPILLLTPEEAARVPKELTQEDLTPAGRQFLKNLAYKITKSKGEPFSFQIDRPLTSNYGVDDVTEFDILAIGNVARASRWDLTITEESTSDERSGYDRWWEIKAKPISLNKTK